MFAEEVKIPKGEKGKGKVLIVGDGALRFKEARPDLDVDIAEDSIPDARDIALYAYFCGDNLPPLSPLYVSPANVSC